MPSKRKPPSRGLRQQVAGIRRKRTILFFVFVVIAFIGVGLMLFGETGLFKYLELKRTKAHLEAELRLLQDENRRLKSQVESLKKDPYYIEKQAREEYGLAKPGEFIYQFQEDGK